MENQGWNKGGRRESEVRYQNGYESKGRKINGRKREGEGHKGYK
jgi:hypothetical protein